MKTGDFRLAPQNLTTLGCRTRDSTRTSACSVSSASLLARPSTRLFCANLRGRNDNTASAAQAQHHPPCARVN